MVHRCFQRERERERRKMTTLESAEAHTHSRTHTRTAPGHVAQRPGRCHKKQKPRRGGRAAAQRPVRKSAAGRGGVAAPSFGGPRINIVRAREKVKATRKCRGEAERESSELNLIFFSARGETEVSLSLPATQLCCPLSRSFSITLSLCLSFPFLFKSVSLSLSLLFRPSAPVCLLAASNKLQTSPRLLTRPGTCEERN